MVRKSILCVKNIKYNTNSNMKSFSFAL